MSEMSSDSYLVLLIEHVLYIRKNYVTKKIYITENLSTHCDQLFILLLYIFHVCLFLRCNAFANHNSMHVAKKGLLNYQL